MSSLASIVASRGPIHLGDPDGEDVRTLQMALSQAGYRVGVDGQFGPRTNQVVRQFQQQHGLHIDGIVGAITAALLDVDHKTLVAAAQGLSSAAPNITAETPEPWLPHDDTASLLKFYGDPRNDLEAWKEANVVPVSCPWELFYEGKAWPHPIQFHKRAAQQLANVLNKIWDAAGHSDESPILEHVKNFSGSGEFREIRGSSRLSCHAFWAAIDWDAERLPLGIRKAASEMPEAVVEAFKSEGFFWGGDFTGRADPQHFQAAHE